MTTQQTKWGPEIKVDGKRPNFLADEDRVWPAWPDWSQIYDNVLAGKITRNDMWPAIRAIRLPADHPHYAQPEAPTPSPELTARMVAFVREAADLNDSFGDRARSIMAELEPVDGDLIEAREVVIAALETEGTVAAGRGRAGEFDTWPVMLACLAAIKRGRQMEAHERDAAIKRKWDDAHDPARRALAEAGK